MSYEVTLTRKQKHDLREIYRYIAVELQSEQNANGQLDRLEENILKLDEMPERFRVYDREPWHSHNLRVMPVDNYLVFYIPDHQVKLSRCSASCTVGGILMPSSEKCKETESSFGKSRVIGSFLLPGEIRAFLCHFEGGDHGWRITLA